jgi:Do/DeqQ family serine protease
MMARRVFVFFLLVLATFFGTLVVTDRLRTSGAAPSPGRPAADAHPPIQSRVPAAAALPDLTGVAERSIGSVTNISSKQVVRTSNSPFANDPIFRRFFGDQDDMFGYRDRLSQSLGSGVVVSSDGYVLTNNHVVGDTRSEVSVTLPDKRELRARIVGVDEATDIAVLKINASNLPTMPWGDSSKLKVAEWVLAIGNPFSLNQSVTLGIVSATGRTLEGQLGSYEDFIQTDAAINPGNSGGALISARGELVGINTAIFTETGGYMGIGFAVPSNLARHVMEELIQYGEVQRGTIGGIVSLQPMTTDLAQRLGAPDARGLLVARMEQQSDAYNAGIRPGDVIVTFNGTAVNDFSHFMRLLADTKIGSTATLGLVREGKTLTLKVPIVKASTRGRRR